ncbi:GyrI-like domain-containing protein [Agreia sp. PsM10]|uniref:GyrI-like domain-containing protein n=1 Tax=Agreia sp. PsM10 TaxID=3030533 RepID=UPI00263AC355|nr:GyrI-like domain-containing protein [Agreia sp. PsM10]MDN4640736.1 GyrI-like domain-containing protein [Agreia sp. PsM10]
MKHDVKKEHPALYSPSSKTFSDVVVPPLQYLAVEGAGDPNTAPAYAAAIEALFSTSYTLKFGSKARGRDYVVAPLEALWTADDPSAFVSRDKTSWQWTALINQPEWITGDDVAAALEAAAAKKPNPALPLTRLITLDEGRSIQILHVGSYDDEGPTLARLHDEYMPQNGLTFAGPHHEIYLNDARRTAPEKLKTVLRQPVRTTSSPH